jgi:ubiquinone/menaquinone biosynthesis C-methylase UbiE
MIDDAEERVSKFYNTVGWEMHGEITEDARRWEDLREYAKEYVSKCRLRVLRHVPENGTNMLDMASGPIQYKEYLEYSRNFNKRYCVDLSSGALDKAKERIGDHGVFLHGSFFSIHLEENFFDCSISLHTIYHIEKDKQEEAVRKLLHITKPGNPVIIVYSNPNALIPRLRSFIRSTLPFRILKRIKTSLSTHKKNKNPKEGSGLYFYAYPIEWWDRFSKIATVRLLPWRSFDSDTQKMLMPNNQIGSKMFDILFNLEERFPAFFVKYFQYPIIILTKKNG